MSNYLYRLAAFAFRRRRLVLAVWLAAAIAAIAIAQASGGKTDDNFTIPGTEAQHASDVLSAKLPAFSGGQSTIVFATTNGSGKVTDPAAKAAIETAMTKLESVPQVATVVDPFHGQLVSDSGKVALGQVQWAATAPDVEDANLDAVKDAMTPVQADGVWLGTKVTSCAIRLRSAELSGESSFSITACSVCRTRDASCCSSMSASYSVGPSVSSRAECTLRLIAANGSASARCRCGRTVAVAPCTPFGGDWRAPSRSARFTTPASPASAASGGPRVWCRR